MKHMQAKEIVLIVQLTGITKNEIREFTSVARYSAIQLLRGLANINFVTVFALRVVNKIFRITFSLARPVFFVVQVCHKFFFGHHITAFTRFYFTA